MSETPPPDEPGQPSTPPAAPPADGQPQPGPAPAPAAYAPAPFPQVLRTPWVNPAKRTQVAVLAVIAFLLVAGAAFVGGVAAGDDHRDRRGPAEFGYACLNSVHLDPGGQCVLGPMRGHMMKPGHHMRPRYAPYPYSPPSHAAPSSPSK
jgi:hypothetical protein